jgi:hypothetical protein
MQRLEVSCAVRPIYGSLGAKGLTGKIMLNASWDSQGVPTAHFQNPGETINTTFNAWFFRHLEIQ